VNIIVSECETAACRCWDESLPGCGNDTFFHRSVWCASVSELTGQCVRRVVATDGAGRLLGGLIVSVREAARLRVAAKPWATPYCGIVYREGLTCRLRTKVGERLVSHLSRNYDYVRIEASTSFGDLLAFRQAGWRISVKSTYLLTKGARPLLESVEPCVRRQVKKAQRNRLSFGESGDPAPLYEMYRACYERQGVGLGFGHESFARFCGGLLKEGSTSLYYVCDEGAQPVAGMLVSRHGESHYYTLAAFRRERAHEAAPSLLLHEYVEARMREGQTFDLVGANEYTPSITAFKSKFNPREVPYVVLEHSSAKYRLCRPLLAALRRGRRLLAS
jgi:hypothetical protein